jgi:GTP cyclohydrolase I
MSDENDPLRPLVESMLKELGEDPGRDGLQRTPLRVAKSLRFLTAGYEQDPIAILNNALFDVTYDEMVMVKDIEFYSLCEHHMLPFFGRIHVGYVPNGKVVGLSKIPRLVEMFARRLQVQERLTTQIAETLESVLEPRGVAVVGEAIHLCMMMRGVEQQNSSAVTSSMRGVFKSDSKTRSEFMDLIRHKRESFA